MGWALELARRADDWNVVSTVVNVAQTATGLNRRVPFLLRHVYNMIALLSFQTPNEAAEAVVYVMGLVDRAGGDGAELNGRYFTCYEETSRYLSRTVSSASSGSRAFSMLEAAIGGFVD